MKCSILARRLGVGLALIAFANTVSAQVLVDRSEQKPSNQVANLAPHFALIQLQQQHSEETPVFVAQGELDSLIASDGGGVKWTPILGPRDKIENHVLIGKNGPAIELPLPR